ncbi:DUF5011 domain-containing protein [Chitinophaga sp. Mgbs1]|uniref:DUF5011 domain-containing protein n=1 Tax=Chitinophaga solisilvae TaxID=1233460 RepID=A0A3S1D2P4_9BACT|nr:DUF5011 domain-containing protein [Chitinophaga solisilvae]
MKQWYIFFMAVVCLACKKTDNVVTQVVSPVYPRITLNGEKLISTGVGGTYNDPGAVAFDSLTNTTTTLTPVANNVDLSRAGFYFVTFQAKNLYGYRSTLTRMVLATTVPAEDDISGTYKRTTNGSTLHVVKIGRGVYRLDNVAGSNDPSLSFPYLIGFTDAASFQGPSQDTPFGAFSLKDTKIVRDGNTVTIQWVINGAGFPASVRQFRRI